MMLYFRFLFLTSVGASLMLSPPSALAKAKVLPATAHYASIPSGLHRGSQLQLYTPSRFRWVEIQGLRRLVRMH